MILQLYDAFEGLVRDCTRKIESVANLLERQQSKGAGGAECESDTRPDNRQWGRST